MPRISPLSAPYPDDVATQLASMMPPGVPPIALFRTFARNLPMTVAMSEWGRYELGRHLSLSMRDREIVILRTCALCRCEYEWGVHVMFFAGRVGFDSDQLASLTHGSAGDPCWTGDRERLLIRVTDALHSDADLGDDLWQAARVHFDEAQMLDLSLLCGWYHAISFAARTARVDREPGAPRFSDVTGNGRQLPLPA